MRILIVYKLDKHNKQEFHLVFPQQSCPLQEKYQSYEHCYRKFFFIYVLRYNLFIFNIMKLPVTNEIDITLWYENKTKINF